MTNHREPRTLRQESQERLASITFYDVETVDDARTFMSALNTSVGCPSPPNTVVTFDVVNLHSSARCDDSLVIRTHQPVSETIDAWCRVANLVAWIRLYPTVESANTPGPGASASSPPTDQEAEQTLSVTATALYAAWNTAR